MNDNESGLILGTTLLAATSWAASHQAEFSIAASIGAVLLSIFGIINYIRKWRKNR
jgi:hypothetical protein